MTMDYEENAMVPAYYTMILRKRPPNEGSIDAPIQEFVQTHGYLLVVGRVVNGISESERRNAVHE